MAADALAPQDVSSHGIQYVLCLIISVYLSFDCAGGFVFLDSVKCPSFFYQLQGFLGQQDAMSYVVIQVRWGNKKVLRSSTKGKNDNTIYLNKYNLASVKLYLNLNSDE